MFSSGTSSRPMLVALVVAAGLLPLAAYWFAIGAEPSISAIEARQLLADPESSAMLVDVRPAEQFEAGHLDGAVNWPAADLAKALARGKLPGDYAERDLLLLCDGGVLSARATRQVRTMRSSPATVRNVTGGIQGWIASAATHPTPGSVALKGGGGRIVNTGWRDLPWHEQWAAVLTGFGVKPAYTLLSLVLVIWLRGRRARDLAALRWAMLSFFVGENFCAANYLIYGEQSLLFEYLHSFGMLLSFGFATYAILEGIDGRVVHFEEREHKCSFVGLCAGCAKYVAAP